MISCFKCEELDLLRIFHVIIVPYTCMSQSIVRGQASLLLFHPHVSHVSHVRLPGEKGK